MAKRFLTLLLLLVLLVPSKAFAQSSWNDVANQVEQYLQQSMQAYQNHDVAKAKDLLNEAYFGPFESDRMEQAIRVNISSKRAAEIEFQFNTIRKKMTAGADQAAVQQEMDELMEMIRADAKTLQKDQEGTGGLWFYSFLIIVREGMEAILVIAAIVAYLLKSGNGSRVKEVYQSAGAAVLASLVTAYLFQSIFHVSGEAQEVLEGVVLILATAILFSMSYWMFNNADARRWKDFIQGKVQDSLTNGKRFALWMAVFLAVYREGAETVLFYQALLAENSSSGGAVWTGIIAGAAVLAVLFYLVRFTSTKIPLRPFFLVSSALLFILAFIFAGEGVKELQASGLISNSQIDGFQTVGFLGIYPSWEGLTAQAILLLLLAMVIVNEMLRRKKHSQHAIQ